MFRKLKAAPPIDPGLELIDAYTNAIVEARMEHLSGAVGYTADAIEHERAEVEALAARYREALRAEYLARTQQP